MAGRVSILGIAGSLRKASYNRALLRAAASFVPEQAVLETFDLEGIPPFNQDNEKEPPDSVRSFKAKIRAADAILIVTPEYNYSVPGVIKNAIDWASRPSGDNAWQGKPVALMSASIGMLGGSRAQYHLRQSFVFLNMYPVNRPEVMVGNAAEKFDAEGRLLDSRTKELMAELLKALVDWTLRLKGA
jgi:chromate reductase, NAD(P)H dehydrogenase (quinone)